MRKAVNDVKRCVACGVCALQCPREAIDIYRGCHAAVDIDKCLHRDGTFCVPIEGLETLMKYLDQNI